MIDAFQVFWALQVCSKKWNSLLLTDWMESSRPSGASDKQQAASSLDRCIVGFLACWCRWCSVFPACGVKSSKSLTKKRLCIVHPSPWTDGPSCTLLVFMSLHALLEFSCLICIQMFQSHVNVGQDLKVAFQLGQYHHLGLKTSPTAPHVVEGDKETQTSWCLFKSNLKL